MIRDVKGAIFDNIPVETVLISVFNKVGLEEFVYDLIEVNPQILILSSTGTYTRIKNNFGTDNLIEVAEYTGCPEMEGGLVKTLQGEIHAGILGERANPLHLQYLKDLAFERKKIQLMNEMLAGNYKVPYFDQAQHLQTKLDAIQVTPIRFIDMVIVDLYPFETVISEDDASFESARGNIDIGGPTIIRAAAKNFLGCASVADINNDYAAVLEHLRSNNGMTSLNFRDSLMRKAFKITSGYDSKIEAHFNGLPPEAALNYYTSTEKYTIIPVYHKAA